MTENKTKKKDVDPFYLEKLAQRYADCELIDTTMYGEWKAIYHKGRPYLWDGRRYCEQTEKEFNTRLRRWLLEHEIPQNNRLIGNLVPILYTLIDDGGKEEMPFYRGGDDEHFPKSENVIAYNNGLLDVSEYLKGIPKLIPHTPRWVSTFCLPYDYDPLATWTQWLKFLNEVFDGDREQIWLLQEWFGYCLTQDTSLQKFMVMAGLPRSGKGTIWRVLRALLGEENSAGFSLFQLAGQFGLYPLVGKMVAYAGEAELKHCSDKSKILENLKSIVGQDTLNIDRKCQDPFTQVLPTRLIIACNEVPSFYETTSALADRLLLLRFNVSFAGREDYDLADKLLTELSGINNWALAGLARLRERGRFFIPTATAKAIEEFKRNNSPTFAFVKDCLNVEKGLDTGNLSGVALVDDPLEATKYEIEKAYQWWCSEEGQEISLGVWFWRRMKTLLPSLEADPNTRGNAKTYHGVRVKPDIWAIASKPPQYP